MQIKSEKLKKNSGITLMSLAIIIIVFLILASITIATIFNNNSVIDRAKEAKEETQIATFKEKLNLAHTNAIMEKGIKGSITIEEYAQILKENQIISDTSIPGGNINEPYKNDEGNDVYEVDSDDGFTFDIIIEKNEEDGTDENITTDNVRPSTEAAKPRVRKIEITGTGTNNIAVKVTVSKLEDGKLSYYYKKKTEPDSSYKALKENTTELTANFTGLEQNVEYNIKVVATNSKGSHELVISRTTGEIPSGTISQKGTTTWNPTTHTASIELETTTTGYTIQYQIGGTSGTWQNYTGPITGLNNGDKVYAVIYDGSNRSEPSIFTIEDKTAPTVTVTPETASTTTSSIKVNVTSKDDQGGMPASPTYKYYIKKSSDANYPEDPTETITETTTEASYTFTGLVQNTSYDVKVTTVDKANNLGEGKAEGITTLTVGGATGDLTTGNITAGTVTWNKDTHKASVTLSTSTNLTIQYKIGEDGTWTPATGTTTTAGKDVTVTNLSNDDLVYARLIDDAGNYGDEAFMTILDGQAPTVTVTPETASTTTSSIKVNVTSKDDQGGMPTSPTYKYYIKKSSDANYPADPIKTGTDTSYTFTGLVQNTSYDVKVTTVDKANNQGEGTAEGITTLTVGGATGDLTTGNVTAGTVTWNKDTHKASVTLSTSTNLTIQYKIGEDGTWTPANGTTATAGKDVTVTNLNHNNLVYARLIDEAGNYGSEAFTTILDGTKPTVTVTKGTPTTSTVTVSVTSSDNEYGMPTSPTYKYYIKKSTDSNYPADAIKTGTDTSYTFTGLKQNTSYDVKVTTVDKANNQGEGKAEGMITKTVEGASSGLQTGNITAGVATWNPSTNKASVILSTSTDKTIQYKIGEDGTWTPANGSTETAGKDVTVTNLSHNNLVYARLIDDAGNYGSEAFATILDGTKPTVTVTKGTPTTSTVTVSVTSSDNEYGMPASPTYKYYIKKSSDANYPADASHTGTQTSHTFTGLVQKTSYDVKVTTVDKANNQGEGKAEGIETKTVEGASSGLQTGNITAGAATWNPSTNKASVILSTSTDKTIQYKIGEDGTWTPATGTTATAGKDVTVTNLNHNDLVYARLIDDAGNYGDEAFITILDGIAPSEASINLTATSVNVGDTLKATVTHTDNESGVATANSKYIWNTTSGKLGTTATAWNTATAFTDNPQTITLNTTTDGTYYLHVLTVDNGGNKAEAVSNEVTIAGGPQVTLADGTKVKLTEDNVYKYLGKKVTNYTGKSTVTISGTSYTVSPTYRLYYVDFDNKYGDGEGTIYLKAECTSNEYVLPVTDTSPSTDTNIKIRALNPSLYASGVTSPSASNNNMKAVTWLTNTTNWASLADTTMSSNINYIVGSPSLEMMMDSYNTHYQLTGTSPDTSTLSETTDRVKLFYQYPYNSNNYGYGVGPCNYGSTVKEYNTYTSKYSVKTDSAIDTMYYPGSNQWYWLASPSADASYYVMLVRYSTGGLVYYDYYNSTNALCPLVSLKSNVQLQLQ